MLVLDENRLMGINQEHFDFLERFMKRDRNHPSVVLWSLGNEEWAIESNIKGARVGATMQAFAQRFDSSRALTAAISGGWDNGTGMVTQVMGYNYILQGDIDEHHKKFPWRRESVREKATREVREAFMFRTIQRLTWLPRLAKMSAPKPGGSFILPVLFCPDSSIGPVSIIGVK